jgi:hypothetical protein
MRGATRELTFTLATAATASRHCHVAPADTDTKIIADDHAMDPD